MPSSSSSSSLFSLSFSSPRERERQLQRQRQQRRLQHRKTTTTTTTTTAQGFCSSSFVIRKMILLLWVAVAFVQVDAYRVGDAVDTDIKISGASGGDVRDVLRSQAPLFGIDTTAEFSLDEMAGDDKSSGSTDRTFSFMFEEGLWVLPTINLYSGYNVERPLKNYIVTFVYSRSAGGGSSGTADNGAIHAVSYLPPQYVGGGGGGNENSGGAAPNAFRVQYKWIQEDNINLQNGQMIMYWIAVIACGYIALTSFGSSNTTSHLDHLATTTSFAVPNGSNILATGDPSAVTGGFSATGGGGGGVPKWD